MERVDKYIDSIYRNIGGNDEDVSITKQEMKNHLLQSIEELEEEGISEEESINIALNRFGDVAEIKNELTEVYSVQRKFSKKILVLALIMLLLSISSMLLRVGIKKYATSTYERLFDTMATTITVKNSISQEEIKKLFDKSKQGFKFDNKELKYISIFEYPRNFNQDVSIQNVELKNAKYIYPSIQSLDNALSQIGYIANASSGKLFWNSRNTWYIKVGYMAYSNNLSVDNILKFLVVGAFSAYWMLFGVWATIEAYNDIGYNIILSILFFIFNIFAYLPFVLINKRRKRLAI